MERLAGVVIVDGSPDAASRLTGIVSHVQRRLAPAVDEQVTRSVRSRDVRFEPDDALRTRQVAMLPELDQGPEVPDHAGSRT